jgi:exodeoxyribonuclease VII large subunit
MPAAENLINAPEFTVSSCPPPQRTVGRLRLAMSAAKSPVFVAALPRGNLFRVEGRAPDRGVIWKLPTPDAVLAAGRLEVIATGKLTTYPGSSKYQIVIEAIEPAAPAR